MTVSRSIGVMVLLWLTVFVTVGCQPVKRTMNLGVENLPPSGRPLWPPLPEVPRYEYAGQLTGWDNFPMATDGEKHLAEEAFRWVVGLDPNAMPVGDPFKGLIRPQTGVVDEAGRIYITDVGQRAVLVFDDVEATLKIWRRAPARETFGSPIGIALGPDGQVLVADAELARIIRLDRTGNPVGEFGKDQLLRPTGLARDPTLKLIYVADTRAHNVKVFNDEGVLQKVIGGPGSQPGMFNAPTHLSFANKRLYVSDTLNARVQIFDDQGEYMFSIGSRGVNVGNMVRPKGVAADSEGNIYAIESFFDHLLIFDSRGKFLLPIGGTGKDVGNFYLPSGVWTDQRNRVFVSDMFNGRVMIFQFLGE